MWGNFEKAHFSAGKSFCLRKPNSTTPFIGNVPAIFYPFTGIILFVQKIIGQVKFTINSQKFFAVSQLT